MACCSCCGKTGACCLDGVCTEETCADCLDAGGVFQGVDTVCVGEGEDECPCDPPADPGLCQKCVDGEAVGYCPEDKPNCCDGVCQTEECGEGTCCNDGGGCNGGGPGPGCFPTGSPNDDGCFCDGICYTVCFDCCGPDAEDCCTARHAVESLFDQTHGQFQKISVTDLEKDFLLFAGVEVNEAWLAALQCGTTQSGFFAISSSSRMSLVLCLQEMEEGAVPHEACARHIDRVRAHATQLRIANA